MAVTQIHLRSGKSIGRMNSFTAIFPEDRPGPFAVLYLLHGYSDDHTAWVRRSNVERYVETLPLIVIMPDGQHGWYCDSKSVPYASYETQIINDLIGFVDTTFATIPERRGRVIAGLSMGGYGALSLAIKHPDKFLATHSFSGATDIAARDAGDDSPFNKELRMMVGENSAGGPNDLFALFKKADPATMPTVSFDCGVDDFLIEDNRKLNKFLTEAKIPHTYTEYPGVHDWNYWDTHIQDVIPRFAELLGIGGETPTEAEVAE